MELQVAIRSLDDAMNEPDRGVNTAEPGLKTEKTTNMENDMTKFTTLIFTTILTSISHAGLAAAPAQPSDSPEHQQLLVRFADLDLTRPDGAAVLFNRIKTAASTVCSPLDSKALANHIMFRKCVADAIERAVTRVDRPQLNTYYQPKIQGSHVARIEIASSNEKPSH